MRFLLFVGSGNSLSEYEVAARVSGSQELLPNIFQFEHDSAEKAIEIVSSLGSSLKLAQEVLGTDPEIESIAKVVTLKDFSITDLRNFDKSATLNLGLKDLVRGSRFIIPKEQFGLTPVIATKHKVAEYFVDTAQKLVFQTIWVHDYAHWIKKDREMPFVNARAGMLPPKIARTMINLLPHFEPGQLLVDPFCGSGRILVEAAEMGFKVFGTDISADQVRDTERNLKSLGIDGQVVTHDATHLSEVISEVDAIVTEPYLGKPDMRPDQAKFIAPGLGKLYLGALKNWSKVLKKGGFVVMVFPILKGKGHDYRTGEIIDSKSLLGYNQLQHGLIYSRPNAQVVREIIILQKA